MPDPTTPQPLTPEEEATIRANVDRRMRLWMVYATVGGGEDVLALARLLATLDRDRERIAALEGALAEIRETCKPMSMSMSGQPVWFEGGTPAGGGSRERIWRLCDAAIEEPRHD